MRRALRGPAARVAIALTVSLCWLAGCGGPPQRRAPTPAPATPLTPTDAGEPVVVPAPEAGRVEPTPSAPPASPPRREDEVSGARPVPPAHPGPGTTTPPPEEEPPLPPYLRVLETFRSGRTPRVAAHPGERNRLIIDTDNVRRLRIQRAGIPLDTRRSIVLDIDGQKIEWVAGSPVVELERSINGAWSAVRRVAP